jgi:phosphate butyryltransferase
MSSDFFGKIVETLDSKKKCRVAIPIANDEACAYAVCQAVKLGVLKATLIGNPEEIEKVYSDVARHENVTLINETNEKAACALAVKEVKEGRADILMKGNVGTSSILKAVLNSETGIKKNPILSHLTFFEFPETPGLKILTDAAICISPDEDTLIKEIENALEAFKCFFNRPAKVAMLAANEKVSEKIPSTVMAANVAKKLQSRDDFIIEGPVSFDLAVSPESARIKKYQGKIQGDADIFIVVLTSRADDNSTKLNSLLLGVQLWQRSLNKMPEQAKSQE